MNAFSLNWLRLMAAQPRSQGFSLLGKALGTRLMAAVKLANKNRKKVRKMNEFCLEIW
jgi:hypothetical protein